MIEDVNFEHETFIREDHRGVPQSISAGRVTVTVSMVFHGQEIANALHEAAAMPEAVGLLHLASAVARRHNVFIGLDDNGAAVSEPAPAPAPTQRQPTGKRNMDLG